MSTYQGHFVRFFDYPGNNRRNPIPMPAAGPALRGEAIPLSVLIRQAHGVTVRLRDGGPSELVEIGRGRLPQRRATGGPISVFLVRLLAVGAFVGLLLAVGGVGWYLAQRGHPEGDDPAPVLATSVSAGNDESPLLMGPVATGVVVIDDALRGFLTSDVDAAFAQLVIREVPCGVPPWGGVPGLACAKGAALGGVRAVILSGCEPGWIAPEAAKAELVDLLTVTPGVYSVARGDGQYVATLAWPDAPERSLVLTISSPGITSYATGCGAPLAAKPGYALKFVGGENR